MGISLVRYDSKPPAPSDPKGNSKFETLLVKIFSRKAKSNTCSYDGKNLIYFPRKHSMVPLDKKAIQKTLGTFRHNQTHPWIIQAYLDILITMCTLTYLKLWYIQNLNIFRTRSIFTTPAYSQPWYIRTQLYSERCRYIQNLRHIQNLVLHLQWSVNYFHGYHYFHKLLFSQSLPRWNKYIEVVSPEVVMLCKLWRVRWPETVNFWYTYWYVQIN